LLLPGKYNDVVTPIKVVVDIEEYTSTCDIHIELLCLKERFNKYPK